ncbi:MAG: hypothetical protein CFE43_21755 [Burkholderiales bacterium PBB3]|nr:MAG: hypothetical protein CFE43_21755 [Burkholderiales bacterium PBB3]
MKPTALALVMAMFPCVGQSQTLCRAGEVDYFSCETNASEKIVSVCGNITGGEIGSESWLQYRFGKKGAIELSYPPKSSDSIGKFEGNYFGKYNVVDLRFMSGRTLYGVELNHTYNGGDAQQRDQPSGGITVTMSKTKHMNIACRTVDASKYFRIFSDLNISLRAYHGETDLLYHFYRHVSR